VHGLTAKGMAGVSGQLGFFKVEATVDRLEMDPGVRLEMDLQDPGGDGRLRLEDLNAELGNKLEVRGTSDHSAGDQVSDLVVHATARVTPLFAGGESIDLEPLR
jgi:hypothetical protein